MTAVNILRRLFKRTVHITCQCPCGAFVPGHLTQDTSGTRWSCDRCDFEFTLTWERKCDS